MDSVRSGGWWKRRAKVGRVVTICVLVGIVAGCGGGDDADPGSTSDTVASEPAASDAPASAAAVPTPTMSSSAQSSSVNPSQDSGSMESSSSASDEESATGAAAPEATTVTVQDLRVNVSCAGESGPAPTVVLLAGMPEPLTTFASLQADLSRSTRVCSYDRPGEGASEAPAGQVSLTDSAAVLQALLQAAKVDGPVVLVGHSLGGLVAAQFAHDYQDRVAGLLLLDATPPSMVSGVLELIPESADGVPAQARAEMASLVSGENPERLVFAGEPVGSLGAVPLTVVRHGKPVYRPIPEYGDRIEKLWTQGQQEWLELSSDATEVVAETSGHYVYQDQPELVLELAEGMITG